MATGTEPGEHEETAGMADAFGPSDGTPDSWRERVVQLEAENEALREVVALTLTEHDLVLRNIETDEYELDSIHGWVHVEPEVVALIRSCIEDGEP